MAHGCISSAAWTLACCGCEGCQGEQGVLRLRGARDGRGPRVPGSDRGRWGVLRVLEGTSILESPN